MKNITAVIVGVLIIGGALFYASLEPLEEDDPKPENLLTEKEDQLTEEVKGVDFEKQEIITGQKNMNYEITLKTNRGEIAFETFSEKAPKATENFVNLAEKGFYDGLIFHRVIDGFMIQGGCPEGTGRGGPGYTFEDEIDPDLEIYQGGYDKGIVAMANSGPDTNGSQFFIMVEDYPLPPQYTIFGKVISGQGVADEISGLATDSMDKPLQEVVIEEVVANDK